MRVRHRWIEPRPRLHDNAPMAASHICIFIPEKFCMNAETSDLEKGAVCISGHRVMLLVVSVMASCTHSAALVFIVV